MSFIISERCYKLQMSLAQKAVLMTLADNANDQGVCWPSISTIVVRTCASERTVQNALSWLAEHGVLVATERVGRSNVYTLTPENYDGAKLMDADVLPTPAADAPPQEVHPAGYAPPQQIHPTPAGDAPQPPQQVHPTPAAAAPITIKNHKKEPSRNRKGRVAAPSAPKNSERPKATDSSDTVSAEQLEAEGVDAQVARDWMTVREAKEMPLTQTVWDAIKAEAKSAGLTVAEAVRFAAVNSWAGFKAGWYKNIKAEEGGADAAKDDLAWLKSWPGILSMGNQLGLKQEPGEAPPNFKLRVVRAANLSPEQIARARADFGVNL